MWSVLLWKKRKNESQSSRHRAIVGMHYPRFRSREERCASSRSREKSEPDRADSRQTREKEISSRLKSEITTSRIILAFLSTLVSYMPLLPEAFATLNVPVWSGLDRKFFFPLSQTRRMSWTRQLLRQNDRRETVPIRPESSLRIFSKKTCLITAYETCVVT